jgi:four helix bundle protein
MGDYKKLRVWKEACTFADRVEQMARQLPQPERTWAFEQLVPAAHAIHENLAEGWGYDSDPQRLKYCRQALSTGNEAEDQLLTLERKGLLDPFESLPSEARSVCAMLAKLKQRLEESIAKSRPPRRRRADSRRPAPGPEGQKPSDEPADSQ